MTTEVPVLRLGLAGFSVQQQERAASLAQAASGPDVTWELAAFPDADAWWFEGARAQITVEGLLRVRPGVPSARAVQLNLPDVDRPTAFTLPLSAPGFQPANCFDLQDEAAAREMLHRFQALLQPMTAQFCLASFIVDQGVDLSNGPLHVQSDGVLLAVVDLRVGVAVLPAAGPSDFAAAVATPRPADAPAVPAEFAWASLAQLMWQFAVRTKRELLPPRYRTTPLYFRRPPRLPQRLLKDSHLLLMRELAAAAASFEELQQNTGLSEFNLARDLGALYLVGAITSNSSRARPGTAARAAQDTKAAASASLIPSVMDSRVPDRDFCDREIPDFTAPAPLPPQ